MFKQILLKSNNEPEWQEQWQYFLHGWRWKLYQLVTEERATEYKIVFQTARICAKQCFPYYPPFVARIPRQKRQPPGTLFPKLKKRQSSFIDLENAGNGRIKYLKSNIGQMVNYNLKSKKRCFVTIYKANPYTLRQSYFLAGI